MRFDLDKWLYAEGMGGNADRRIISYTVAERAIAAAEAALLAQAEKRETELVARLAKGETKTVLEAIDERDKAEEALSQAYYLITGNSPEWSNNFGYDQALIDIDDAQKCLRSEIKQIETLRDEDWNRAEAAEAMLSQVRTQEREKALERACSKGSRRNW